MTGIDGLNDILRVRSVIRPDYGRCFGGLFGENGWRKSECVEISAFCDCSILEDNQEARIIDPLDLKPSTNVFPLYEGRLDISRLQLLREAGKRENTGDASRELGERGCHDEKESGDELKGQKRRNDRGLVRKSGGWVECRCCDLWRLSAK